MPRLADLALQYNLLTGAIPNFNLPNIISMLINDNGLAGTIPQLYCPLLQNMDISNNSISGTIPGFEMPNLKYINLANNKLSDSVPDFRMTPDLCYLHLYGNQLTGSLPTFDQINKLIVLDISNNSISGSIPRFTFPELELLDLSNNSLDGSIPDLTMPRLLYLKLHNNHLSGSIPRLLMPLVVEMDLKYNNLSGSIPFLSMPSTRLLSLGYNSLSGDIPELSMSQLEYLNLESNLLTGKLSKFNMPKLKYVILSRNKLSGTIPLFESRQLFQLFLDGNDFLGNIPVLPASLKSLNITDNPTLIYPQSVLYQMYASLKGKEWLKKTGWLISENVCSWHGIFCNGECSTVQSELSLCPITRISLVGNNLSGPLASGTWLNGLEDLEELNLENNRLEGSIPELNMPKLRILNLNLNQLQGVIPDFDLPKLTLLNLANNQLTDFSNKLILPSITILDVSYNRIQGTLPSLANLTSLVRLDASFNRLTSISSLNLVNLQTLLLFNNDLIGHLPDLHLPQLSYMDVSNNRLDEPLPEWVDLVNLEHLIFSSNPSLTGPLPKGMDRYSKISSVDIKNTKMHRIDKQLLPSTLRPIGQYQMLNPSDNFQCPILVNGNVSRSNIDISPEYYDFYNCRCQPATFGVRNKCMSCPSSCNCETGWELKGCFPYPSLDNMVTIVPCSNPLACETVLSSDFIMEIASSREEVDSCLKGYEGRVCSKCKNGYGAQGRSCVECESILVYSSFVVGPVVIICFIVYLSRSEPSNSGKLGILIFHTQTLSVIATAMSSTPTVENSISLPFSVSSIQMPSLGCVVGTNNAFTLMAVSFGRLPLLALLGYMAFKMNNGYNRDKVFFVVLNLARCMYYPIALETFGVFSCTLSDKGHELWFLNAWPWIECSPATYEYKNMLVLAIPTFFLFVCGFPLLLWCIIRDNMHNINQSRNAGERESRRTRFGFLYLPFKKEYRFWGLVTTGRLLCFGFVIRIVPYTSLATIFILLLVLLQGSIWLQYSRNPFLSVEENAMELLSLYTIFFSYFLVLISGFVGDSIWMIGFVIALNGMVLVIFLWKIMGGFVMAMRGKGRIRAVMVNSDELSCVPQENHPRSLDVEMKSVAPTDS
eukprot:TRINITY_DN1873_c0_g2_i3.p1 TRINITY_DN1873_c0_g2~~TRINITY_DN1873_c0_g2_i3.p1  ORF type:complete len:1109 (-),score=121.51 TRINITY_DN1873_c0_g2_i3:313-3639(-)